MLKLRVTISFNRGATVFVLQSMEPSGGSKYDPVYGLLKEATLLQVGWCFGAGSVQQL